jgi:hypothetical protein
MAHFAELDENNIVLRVLVIDDSVEHDGENWCHNTFGGRWKQTSYNNRIRKQYAGIGYYYDEENDVFIGTQPFPSWVLDSNFDWQPPVSYPVVEQDSRTYYIWNEETLSWIEVA